MKILNDSLNTRNVNRRVKREIQRRLQRTMPGAQLMEAKHCSIPLTHYEATVFIYHHKNRMVIVTEFCQPGLPHIYRAFAVSRNPNKNLQAMVVGLASLSKTIIKDKRFSRGNIIQLNGVPH